MYQLHPAMSCESEPSPQAIETAGGPQLQVVRVDKLSSTIQSIINDAFENQPPGGTAPTPSSLILEVAGGKYMNILQPWGQR